MSRMLIAIEVILLENGISVKILIMQFVTALMKLECVILCENKSEREELDDLTHLWKRKSQNKRIVSIEQ